MIEKALHGSKEYWTWVAFLLIVMAVGAAFYVQQWNYGLGITGMSRDVSWGVYIAQFTFLVGVAAGGLMVVLPYYLHNYKEFGRITILGEFMAIAAVLMCLMFIIADLGQPMRAMNVLLHPTPNSMLFWDMIVLNGYLALNLICGWAVLNSEYKGVKYSSWVKPFIYLSIPWAVSIHTVTAFLYAGLPGRDYWLSPIVAPRFLASAFAAGPALLLLIALILERKTLFKVGQIAKDKLVTIITYAALINFFFIICEMFSAFYSQYPSKMYTKAYLFWGLVQDGKVFDNLAPFMRISIIMGVIGIALILVARSRKSDWLLGLSCALIFLSLWIDKGVGMVIGGFVPNPFGQVTEYYPSVQELGITAAVWATGFLILTVLYKVAIQVKLEKELG
ncbi:MAG: NrfD/PsrC family molybdoenzyme membrane anchor subunit [Desulfurivibrio sp.]|nr:NrfD/PsrC family molybdoenzyme membrane anchor subunit [Desulfurivibrio sp.]